MDVNNEGFFEPLAQEPVASCNGMPAYEGPLSKTQRTWVGLTWSDIPNEWVGNVAFMEGAKWAETKNKEKNSA